MVFAKWKKSRIYIKGKKLPKEEVYQLIIKNVRTFLVHFLYNNYITLYIIS